MYAENVEAVTVFNFLAGQFHTHSIKTGSGKDDYDTWVVLRYDSIYYAFQFLGIPKSHWKNLFRKLLVITDVEYNHQTEIDESLKLQQFVKKLTR